MTAYPVHTPSEQIPVPQTERPYHLPPHTIDANFQKGVESFNDGRFSGITLTSIDDVWHFLQSEIYRRGQTA